MPAVQKSDVVEMLDAGQDLTLATVRPDGWPQATTVSYASDGLDIYVGTAAHAQKAQNIAHDDRVSATVDLPYASWNEIRGLSLSGRARRVTDPTELARIGALFMKKFPQIADQAAPEGWELAMFHIAPEFISVLDYRKGFGHMELVRRAELDQPAGTGAAAV